MATATATATAMATTTTTTVTNKDTDDASLPMRLWSIPCMRAKKEKRPSADDDD